MVQTNIYSRVLLISLISYASIKSPSLYFFAPTIPIPHSKPSLTSSASKIAGIVNKPGEQIAQVLSAKSQSGEAA